MNLLNSTSDIASPVICTKDIFKVDFFQTIIFKSKLMYDDDNESKLLQLKSRATHRESL